MGYIGKLWNSTKDTKNKRKHGSWKYNGNPQQTIENPSAVTWGPNSMYPPTQKCHLPQTHVMFARTYSIWAQKSLENESCFKKKYKSLMVSLRAGGSGGRSMCWRVGWAGGQVQPALPNYSGGTPTCFTHLGMPILARDHEVSPN